MPATLCGNPLWLEWVHEWLEQARERNSKGVTVYKKAHDSLKNCPVTWEHPDQLVALKGFGPTLCSRLTKKLQEHCDAEGLPMPQKYKKKRKTLSLPGESDDDEDEEEEDPKPKKARKTKPYVPTLGSGAYAIVMALATLGDEHLGVSKEEVIALAQSHTEASFTAPSQANKFYTAWNSMKTLEDKDIVHARGRPKRYRLLDEGWEVAKRMQKAHGFTLGAKSSEKSKSATNTGDGVDVEDFGVEDSIQAPQLDVPDIPQGEAITSETALPSFTPVTFPPGSFTVELVIDNREVRAKKDRDYVQNSLATRGVDTITRGLPLGDILWIAKITHPILAQRHGEEVLLDYVIERKRLDDLIGSIKDGRFRDQKFRLTRSGVKNIIYIIEDFSMNADHYQKYDEAVRSAIASMQVVNGFFVKQTLTMDDTIRYLVSMTKILKQKYEAKPLKIIPTNIITTQNYLPLLTHLAKKEPSSEYHITYPVFTALSNKSDTMTLRDVYLKMLMCTRGVTGEKAIEVQKRWKTPIEFYEAYKQAEEGRGVEEARKRKWELVSGKMGDLIGRKKIAKVLSGKISEVWGNEEY